MPKIEESLKLWERYGEFILMAAPYQDRVLQEARGCTIVDVDGNSLIDLEAGQICSILGHNHPKLIQRIVEQAQAVLHHGSLFLSRPIFEAAERMASITPGRLKKSLFLSTGAEANECAFRIAKLYTGRRGIVGFDRGYSGLSLATMSAGINSRDTSLAVPGTLKILTPDCAHCPVGSRYPGCDFLCLHVSERFLDAHCKGEIAAFIVEPILSAGGMVFPPPGYFQMLRQLATRLGALLIADEAQTGMGKTGRWFGIEHDEVVPDILVFSKGVGGGFPASGVIVTDAIADGILGRFSNFSSHQSDPVAAAAVATVIDIIEEEQLVARAERSGSRLVEGLRTLSNKYQLLGNIRGRGLMIGADANAIPARGWSAEETGKTFECLCREAGVHLKSIHQGTVFRILPPLTISDDEIDTVLDIFEQVTRRILDGRVGRRQSGNRNPFTRRCEDARAGTRTLRGAMRKAWESSPAAWYTYFKRVFRRAG
jgi:2,2-dialkylglycine decarboxylase (pyruvate)